jgi:hypothetical protein
MGIIMRFIQQFDLVENISYISNLLDENPNVHIDFSVCSTK